MILYITIAISFIYIWLIISLIKHWEEIPNTSIAENFTPKISLSVIIIARNEEENITSCLNSILENDFPKDQFEIIVVDDHSEDRTIQLIESLNQKNITVLPLADYLDGKKVNAFKKVGIKYAFEYVQHDYILHTDADCIVPKNWLRTTAYNFERGIKLQAAPIGFKPVTSFLHWFQQLDMYTLMASTNAGIRSQNWYLANGANLAYHKASLLANIYDESDQYASGDDVFLINQMAENNANEIYFEPNIIVNTKPVDLLNEFINQRIRWAGKNKNLAKGKMKNILVIPVITNLWFFVLIFLVPFYPKLTVISLITILLLKCMVDYILLNYMQEQLNPNQKNRNFLLAFICYPFYIILIGIFSLIKKSYQWKSRKVQ